MSTWRPEAFNGSRARRRYFEGWYFKQVTPGPGESWSFIPGVALGAAAGEGYSFVQAIEGATGKTWWFQYPLAAFSAAKDRLLVRVGGSEFSERGLRLELAGPEGSFRGELAFGPFRRLPLRPFAPGVMGPFSFLPFMECRHGLVSLDHSLAGAVEVALPESPARRVDFAGGRGYAEKDWGRSMPRSWVWTQSNNFPERGDSFMLSVARIPWLGAEFPGFLCAASLGGALLLETTWTGARLVRLRVGEKRVEAAVRRGHSLLEIEVERARGGFLRAPVDGLLSRRIAESVDATLRLRWTLRGRLEFEGEAAKAGLETVGDPASLASALEEGDKAGGEAARLAARRMEALPGTASGQ
jgi:hypothetical protein